MAAFHFERPDLEKRLAAALDEHRLVVLLGPHGAGKSSLIARARAHQKATESRPVELWVWCSFDEAAGSDSPLESGEHKSLSFLDIIAAQLGLAGQPDVNRIAVAMQARAGWLVLDSCEAFREEARELVPQLVNAGVRVLVGSTAALDIPSEHVISVKQLSLREAVEYFALYAVRRGANFLRGGDRARIEKIVGQLDPWPLPLALAASARPAESWEQLESNLRDLLDLDLDEQEDTQSRRHRSLRAVHEWAFGQLPSALADSLERLSVYQGTFETEDAVAVIGPSAAAAVAELRTRHLVFSPSPNSFTLLDSTRRFAQERLATRAWLADTLQARTARMASLAEQVASDLMGNQPRIALDRLRTRFNDFRQTAGHFAETGQIPQLVKLVTHLERGCRWGMPQNAHVELVQLALGKSTKPEDRGPMLLATAKYLSSYGETDEAMQRLNEAVAADPTLSVVALVTKWTIEGQTPAVSNEARSLIESARFESLDVVDQSSTLWYAGLAHCTDGDLAKARATFERCLDLAIEHGSNRAFGNAYSGLGVCALGDCHVAEALSHAANLERVLAEFGGGLAGWGASYAANIIAICGRREAADRAFQRGYEAYMKHGHSAMAADLRTARGGMALWDGRSHEARESLSEIENVPARNALFPAVIGMMAAAADPGSYDSSRIENASRQILSSWQGPAAEFARDIAEYAASIIRIAVSPQKYSDKPAPTVDEVRRHIEGLHVRLLSQFHEATGLFPAEAPLLVSTFVSRTLARFGYIAVPYRFRGVIAASDGTWFECSSSEPTNPERGRQSIELRVDLSGKRQLKDVMRALVECASRSEDSPIDPVEMGGRIWPIEEVDRTVLSRLYTSVRRLRDMGLRPYLSGDDAGYRLCNDAHLLVVRSV